MNGEVDVIISGFAGEMINTLIENHEELKQKNMDYKNNLMYNKVLTIPYSESNCNNTLKSGDDCIYNGIEYMIDRISEYPEKGYRKIYISKHKSAGKRKPGPIFYSIPESEVTKIVKDIVDGILEQQSCQEREETKMSDSEFISLIAMRIKEEEKEKDLTIMRGNLSNKSYISEYFKNPENKTGAWFNFDPVIEYIEKFYQFENVMKFGGILEIFLTQTEIF